MSRKMRFGFTAAVVALGWACASSQAGLGSAGSGQTVTRVSSGAIDTRITSETRVSAHAFDAAKQDVWESLVDAYGQLEIPIPVEDRLTWRVGNPRAQIRRIGGERLSRFFECGQASMGRPRADQYDVTFSIFSRLDETEDGRIVLLTEADGSARPNSISTNPIHCSSKGTLEVRIADMVAELLAQR